MSTKSSTKDTYGFSLTVANIKKLKEQHAEWNKRNGLKVSLSAFVDKILEHAVEELDRELGASDV